MISFNLAKKKALVTGAASGIGLATAKRLALAGATVAINDLPSNERLGVEVSALRDQGCEVFAVPGDVSKLESAAAIVATALDKMGGLDYLVNNAGAPGTKVPIALDDFEALTPGFWSKMLDVNLLSAFWMTKAARPALIEAKGSVVNTVSEAAFMHGASSTAYACAKTGLVQLTRHLAKAMAPDARVNGIAPGLVNSPWECSFGDQEEFARNHVPLARVGQPGEYADLIVFLAVSGTYITGETILANGGTQL